MTNVFTIADCAKVETFIKAAIFDNQHDFGGFSKENRQIVKKAIGPAFGKFGKDISGMESLAKNEDVLLEKLGLNKYGPNDDRKGMWYIPENGNSSYASQHYSSIEQSPAGADGISLSDTTLAKLGEIIDISDENPLYLTIDTLNSPSLQTHICDYSKTTGEKSTNPNILVVNCPQTHFDPATKITAYTKCGRGIGIKAQQTISPDGKERVGTINARGPYEFPPLSEILVSEQWPIAAPAVTASATSTTSSFLTAPQASTGADLEALQAQKLQLESRIKVLSIKLGNRDKGKGNSADATELVDLESKLQAVTETIASSAVSPPGPTTLPATSASSTVPDSATSVTATPTSRASPPTCNALVYSKGHKYVCRKEMLADRTSNALFLTKYRINAYMHADSSATGDKKWEACVFIQNTVSKTVVIADKSYAKKRDSSEVDLPLAKLDNTSKLRRLWKASKYPMKSFKQATMMPINGNPYTRFHLLCKRLGDAGQALYALSATGLNALVTGDRALVANAMLYQTPIIIFCNHRKSKDGDLLKPEYVTGNNYSIFYLKELVSEPVKRARLTCQLNRIRSRLPEVLAPDYLQDLISRTNEKCKPYLTVVSRIAAQLTVKIKSKDLRPRQNNMLDLTGQLLSTQSTNRLWQQLLILLTLGRTIVRYLKVIDSVESRYHADKGALERLVSQGAGNIDTLCRDIGTASELLKAIDNITADLGPADLTDTSEFDFWADNLTPGVFSRPLAYTKWLNALKPEAKEVSPALPTSDDEQKDNCSRLWRSVITETQYGTIPPTSQTEPPKLITHTPGGVNLLCMFLLSCASVEVSSDLKNSWATVAQLVKTILSLEDTRAKYSGWLQAQKVINGAWYSMMEERGISTYTDQELALSIAYNSDTLPKELLDGTVTANKRSSNEQLDQIEVTTVAKRPKTGPSPAPSPAEPSSLPTSPHSLPSLPTSPPPTPSPPPSPSPSPPPPPSPSPPPPPLPSPSPSPLSPSSLPSLPPSPSPPPSSSLPALQTIPTPYPSLVGSRKRTASQEAEQEQGKKQKVKNGGGISKSLAIRNLFMNKMVFYLTERKPVLSSLFVLAEYIKTASSLLCPKLFQTVDNNSGDFQYIGDPGILLARIQSEQDNEILEAARVWGEVLEQVISEMDSDSENDKEDDNKDDDDGDDDYDDDKYLLGPQYLFDFDPIKNMSVEQLNYHDDETYRMTVIGCINESIVRDVNSFCNGVFRASMSQLNRDIGFLSKVKINLDMGTTKVSPPTITKYQVEPSHSPKDTVAKRSVSVPVKGEGGTRKEFARSKGKKRTRHRKNKKPRRQGLRNKHRRTRKGRKPKWHAKTLRNRRNKAY